MSNLGKFTLTWCSLVAIISILGVESLPATTSEPTTHIISFVKQKKLKQKHDEFPDFDFESIRAKGNASDPHEQKMRNGAINLLVGRLMQQTDPGLDNSIDATLAESNNSTKPSQSTDDAADQSQNTLENDLRDGPSRNDSSQDTGDADPLRSRVKQSIPVLEPVKHLLNTVRDGAFGMNHSSPGSGHHSSHSKHHHQLVGSDGADSPGNGGGEHHDSAVIETEEEREMVNESTGFHFLELLGTIAGMVWGFFTNIQKFFAASSGGAIAASSSSSSGASR